MDLKVGEVACLWSPSSVGKLKVLAFTFSNPGPPVRQLISCFIPMYITRFSECLWKMQDGQWSENAAIYLGVQSKDCWFASRAKLRSFGLVIFGFQFLHLQRRNDTYLLGVLRCLIHGCLQYVLSFGRNSWLLCTCKTSCAILFLAPH